MNETFTPERAAAFRAAITDQIAATQAPRKRALIATGLVLAGVVGGAGITTAAYAATDGFAPAQTPTQSSGQPSPGFDTAVAAPPGVQPGAPIVSLLGDTTTLNVIDTNEISLTNRPDAATHVRVTVTPLTPGSMSWGTEPGGNNPSATASQADIDSGHADARYDSPLDSTTSTLFINPSHGFTGILALQYVNYVPTHLAVNAQGNTYGVDGGPDGAPDLISVYGTGPGGTPIEGYAYATSLYAGSPDYSAPPSSPEEALKRQDETRKNYPTGWDVPVYKSNGTTQIGTFHIGN